jgi:beta-lactamase class A
VTLGGQLQVIEESLNGGILGIAADFEGEQVFYNAETLFPTASCIKIAIIEEISQQNLDVSKPITVESADIVRGSGVLSTLTTPITLPLEDLAMLTLSISDNTASNACLRAVGGPEAVNSRLRGWGIENTTIHRPIKFRLEPTHPPHTATGTPLDFLKLLGKLSESTKAKMAECTDSYMLPRYLEVNPFAEDLKVSTPDFTVVHKTGGIEGVRSDVGFITSNSKTISVAVFTKDTPDPRWTPENLGCIAVGQVAKLLTDRFFAHR